MSDTLRRYREPLAGVLLVVCGCYVLGGIIAVFGNVGELGLAQSAANYGQVFYQPLLLASLAGVVALSTAFEPPASRAASFLGAVVILGGLALALAFVSWIAAFWAAPMAGGGRWVTFHLFYDVASVGLLALVWWWGLRSWQHQSGWAQRQTPADPGRPAPPAPYSGYGGFAGAAPEPLAPEGPTLPRPAPERSEPERSEPDLSESESSQPDGGTTQPEAGATAPEPAGDPDRPQAGWWR